MKQTESEWYSLKASVADAFADIYNAQCNGTLSEGQTDNLLVCLKALNDYLEEDSTTYEPDTELELIRKRNDKIGSSVVLWLSVNDPTNAIDALTECENQVEESDKEKWETLHEITSLLVQIKKDVQE